MSGNLKIGSVMFLFGLLAPALRPSRVLAAASQSPTECVVRVIDDLSDQLDKARLDESRRRTIDAWVQNYWEARGATHHDPLGLGKGWLSGLDELHAVIYAQDQPGSILHGLSGVKYYLEYIEASGIRCSDGPGDASALAPCRQSSDLCSLSKDAEVLRLAIRRIDERLRSFSLYEDSTLKPLQQEVARVQDDLLSNPKLRDFVFCENAKRALASGYPYSEVGAGLAACGRLGTVQIRSRVRSIETALGESLSASERPVALPIRPGGFWD